MVFIGTYNEYLQHMLLWRNKKNINTFGWEKSAELELYAIFLEYSEWPKWDNTNEYTEHLFI